MKGLNNLGNTCYMNAAIQMLIQNEEFCHLILYNQNKTNTLNILSNFIKEYYNTHNNSSLNAQPIKSIVETENNIFIGNNQHDATEFIICLFDIINKELHNIKSDTNLNNIFNIQFNTKIQCQELNCNNITSTIENNLFLLLNIDNDSQNLSDLLRKFKLHEILDNDNKYYCDKCTVKTNALKKTFIISTSKHLIIILKKYHNQKYNIDIPVIWKNYILKGIIIHSGTLDGGHYMYISNIEDSWVLFNDNVISLIPNINQYLPNAYCLYLQRIE